jgi:hypothetical protein
MSKRLPSNVPASVRARLLNRAKEAGEDYNALLARYVAERFLYRLGRSAQRDRFVLKGAMLFVLWEGDLHRMTRDLDLLSRGSPEVDDVVAAVREVCVTEVDDDGVTFHPETVAGERIREDQAYEGVRVRVLATLGGARVPLQVDVGFGDAVTPGVEEAELPTVLGSPAPHVKAYPRETAVAEKVQAMVLLGIANTRMKDFYDTAHLAHHFAFSGQALVDALEATFSRRGTPLPSGLPLALSEEFSGDAAKQQQWRAFLKKAGLAGAAPDAGSDLPDVVENLRRFLEAPLSATREGVPFAGTWIPPGPWRLESP